MISKENTDILINLVFEEILDYAKKRNKKINIVLIQIILHDYNIKIENEIFDKLKAILPDL